MSKLTLKNILVYSIDTEKYFYTEFCDSINIIHGRNTSGKSTLIQSILYAMGINDSSENLDEITKGNVLFKLDCKLSSNAENIDLSFVRSDDTLVVRYGGNKPIRYDGIGSNNSYEYGRYKNLFSDLFKFDLKLQKQTELTKAPLEAAFLPFYISQSVGWVYIRESIGDYRFYKDFKFDYLDYYTGLRAGADRIRKYELEKEKKSIEFEIKQLVSYKSKDDGLKLAELLNERFKGKTLEYLEKYSDLSKELSVNEANHTKLCNSITMLRGRQKILSQIIKNIKNQKPKVDQCPTCDQQLPGDLRDIYLYSQDVNDAIREKDKVSGSIKKSVSSLNSVEKKVISLRSKILDEYGVLDKFNAEGIDFNSWLDYQANLKLLDNVALKKSKCEKRISDIENDIGELGSDENIDVLRKEKEKDFFQIFYKKASSLGVKIPSNRKYRDLYSISSFPYQGVELHKIIMAYNFSFNEMVSKNSDIHSFPFLLDAIFKEDIDTKSREEIFEFLARESNRDTQVLFTVAEFISGENERPGNNLFVINEVNKKYFSSSAKQICIGDAVSKRSFLSQSGDLDEDILSEAISLLDSI